MTRTPTPTLITALRILARDIQSGDGVANAAIAEAADRLEEYEKSLADIRDAVLHERHQIAEAGLDCDQVNAVLGVIDDHDPRHNGDQGQPIAAIDKQPDIWFVAACSGLRYRIPGACGGVSSILVDGKRFPVLQDSLIAAAKSVSTIPFSEIENASQDAQDRIHALIDEIELIALFA